MEQIKICCTSGITLPFEDIHIYPSDLKKHSLIEIERMCESIVNDGFLFPLAIGKVKDKNYIIDGECAYYALGQLEYRGYEIPDIPVFFVCTKESTIKKNILIATSTNHCVTRNSLMRFSDDEKLLKKLAFNEGTLIDFYTVEDIDRCFEVVNKKPPKTITGDENFTGLLREGLI